MITLKIFHLINEHCLSKAKCSQAARNFSSSDNPLKPFIQNSSCYPGQRQQNAKREKEEGAEAAKRRKADALEYKLGIQRRCIQYPLNP